LNFTSTLEAVKYWAGQRLLQSALHPHYLKLTGKDRPLPTYDHWLAAEALDLADRKAEGALPSGYRLVLSKGACLAASGAYWLAQAAEDSGADLIYADEDVIGPDGRRGNPIFKPAWSPELFAHCDYLGGAYLIREGVDADDLKGRKIAHVPRILIHRDAPAEYSLRTFVERTGSELVSVIVCSRNPTLTAECFETLRSNTTYARYEIILIDHRAGMAAVAERFGAQRIPYDEEFNFARMCNTGARASRGELLLFLNDDTAPLDPAWMSHMAGQAERREVGPVGALLTFPDGRVQHAGIYIGTSNGAGHPGRLTSGSPPWPWLSMTREQMAVTGACLTLRREVFEEVGGFDESFPVNYNDTDLCLRCGQAGYKAILEARARVEHRESTTRKIGINYGERRRFLDRWAELIGRGDPYWNANLTDNELLLPDPEAFKRVPRWR